MIAFIFSDKLSNLQLSSNNSVTKNIKFYSVTKLYEHLLTELVNIRAIK